MKTVKSNTGDKEETVMKRFVVMVAVGGSALALAACGGSDDEQANETACPPGAATDTSYSSTFEAPVNTDETEHVLRVTKNGRPVSGARVCVDTAMVGMTEMHYSAEGDELDRGRYEVPFQFEMEGEYRGNLVAEKGGKEISIPLAVTVPSVATEPGRESDTTASDTAEPDDAGSHATESRSKESRDEEPGGRQSHRSEKDRKSQGKSQATKSRDDKSTARARGQVPGRALPDLGVGAPRGSH